MPALFQVSQIRFRQPGFASFLKYFFISLIVGLQLRFCKVCSMEQQDFATKVLLVSQVLAFIILQVSQILQGFANQDLQHFPRVKDMVLHKVWLWALC